MDQRNAAENPGYFQHTLKDSFTCVSRGLHTGLNIVMRVTPADANTGIVFVRREVESRRAEIHASWRNVSDTRLSTTIVNNYGVRVSTVEHLLAALYACGIDNARVILNGPEVPAMDGSAMPFVTLIKQAGKQRQEGERKAILIRQAVSLSREGKFARFLPSPLPWLHCVIEFDAVPIGKQTCSVAISEDIFERELANARTFGFQEQIPTLHKLGLAQGGSLQNAVLIEHDRVVNSDGLRFVDEFVRHKAIDAIGDLALLGVAFVGQFTSVRGGHELTNALIQKLMANEYAWEFTTLRRADAYWRASLTDRNVDLDLSRMILEKNDL